MVMHTIYRLIDINNNVTLYVGQSIDFKQTMLRHKHAVINFDINNDYHNTDHNITKVLNASGWENIEVEVIDHVEGASKADSMVADSISKYNPKANATTLPKPNAGINAEKAMEIFNAKGKHQLIADRYGISRPMVSLIKKKKRWAKIHLLTD